MEDLAHQNSTQEVTVKMEEGLVLTEEVEVVEGALVGLMVLGAVTDRRGKVCCCCSWLLFYLILLIVLW